MTDPEKNIHVLMVGHEGNEAIREAMAKLPHTSTKSSSAFMNTLWK